MRWWAPIALPRSAQVEARLGRLRLRVTRREGLIGVAHHLREDAENSDAEISEPGAIDPDLDGWTVQRFAMQVGDAPLTLVPLTAPRPVVARPERPFSVAPGHEVRVFVSTPVWVSVVVQRGLVELPVVPPKDTWFGTFAEGALCYAMRTHLRMDLRDVVPRAHRAIAPVVIRNEGVDPLQVERLNIPVPRLTVHADERDRLWTQELLLVRHEGQDLAELHLGKRGPGPVISGPRDASAESPVMRVFNSVFR